MVTSYSYSMLQAAYKCNRYFKLLYVDKLKPDTLAKNADLVFGSAMHYALEEYLVNKEDIIGAFDAYWSTETAGLEYGRYGKEELEKIAHTLLERFVRLHAKKITVDQGERRLYATLGDGNGRINVEGTPDLCGSFEGEKSIIDFKTSGYRYTKEKISINEQMVLYAHLASHNGYQAKQIVYIVFIKGTTPSIQIIKKTLTPEHTQLILDNVIKQCNNLSRMQLEGSYTYNSNSCQMGMRQCEYFNNCWSKEILK